MNVSTKSLTTGLAASLAIALLPALARADGGVVLTRETRGSLVITIFAPPEVLAATETELGVLVQSRDSGEVVLDAAVELTLTPPESGHWLSPEELGCASCRTMDAAIAPGQPFSLPAPRARGTNQLLHAASVALPATGTWQLVARVDHPEAQASVACTLPVVAPRSRLAALWPYLALPLVAIALFGVNQWLRDRREGQPRSLIDALLRERSVSGPAADETSTHREHEKQRDRDPHRG
jgi:hypothetical protein